MLHRAAPRLFPSRAAGTRPAGAPPRDHLALTLGVLTVALFLVVLLTLSSTEAAWRRSSWVTQVAEPARAAIQEVQAALLGRIQGVEGLRATGTAHYGRQVEGAVQREQAALRRLYDAADRVHPSMRPAVRTLEVSLDTAWLRAGGGAPGTRGWAAEFHAYHQAMAAAQEVERLVVQETDRRRRRLAVQEGRASAGALMLVPIALCCLWLALRSVMRLRAAAAVAEVRRAELEEITREKAALVYEVTRYLKQPLSTAAGRLATLELSAADSLDAPARDALAAASGELRRSLQTLNDLAELSTADAGTMPMRHSAVKLAALLEGTTGGLIGWASAKGVRLVHAPPPPEVELSTDVERLRGILRNLLASAIELAPQGAVIHIESSLHSYSPEGMDGPWVAIVISEAPLHDPALARVSSQELLLRSVGPSGELGLTLSQRVATLLGGTLSAQGGGPGGTRFALWLPNPASAREEPDPADLPALAWLP